jgi:hypothetical protein
LSRVKEPVPLALLLAVFTLPESARRVLEQGPIDEGPGRDQFYDGESCRVCLALRPYVRGATPLMHVLNDWHERRDGESDESWYARCLVIYRLAGWSEPI